MQHRERGNLLFLYKFGGAYEGIFNSILVGDII